MQIIVDVYIQKLMSSHLINQTHPVFLAEFPLSETGSKIRIQPQHYCYHVHLSPF